MCIHHVMNIQHAHCSLVGPDHSTWKVGPQVWVHWPTVGIPTCRLQPSPKLHVGCASISWASMLSCLNLCAIMMSSVKLEVHNISWCCQEDQTIATGNMHKKFGKDWTCISGSMLADRRTHIQTHTQTDRQTDTQTWSSQYSTPLLGAE